MWFTKGVPRPDPRWRASLATSIMIAVQIAGKLLFLYTMMKRASLVRVIYPASGNLTPRRAKFGGFITGSKMDFYVTKPRVVDGLSRLSLGAYTHCITDPVAGLQEHRSDFDPLGLEGASDKRGKINACFLDTSLGGILLRSQARQPSTCMAA